MPDQHRHHVNPRTLKNARRLRQEMSVVETILWNRLRCGRLNGLKFRRQQPLGPFVADFFCADAKLVIELDGASHFLSIVEDERRTQWIERHGIEVIRFCNEEVLGRLDYVLEEITAACQRRGASAG